MCLGDFLSFQAYFLPSLSALSTLPSPSQDKPHRQIGYRIMGMGMGWGGQTGKYKFLCGGRTMPVGVAGLAHHQGLALTNSHCLAKGVYDDPRAAPAGRKGGSSISLSCGSMWSRGMSQCHKRGGSGQVRRKPKNTAASSHLKFNVSDLCFSLIFFFLPFPPPPPVSSDQIEQLHRRFKQLSGDQPTIR